LEYELSVLQRLNVDFKHEVDYQTKHITNIEIELETTTNENYVFKRENEQLIETFSGLKSQISLLTSRIRSYDIEPPTYKMDPCLICPSSRKSLEANQLLMKVLDATRHLIVTYERKK
jgi:hypothetical protein